MPNSLRNKIKHFCYKGYLSESEKNKLLNALDEFDFVDNLPSVTPKVESEEQ